jgi:hypothetical protein
MVISTAMLGIGSAGTLLAICPRGTRNYDRIYSGSNISLYAALTGISLLICYIISNYIPFDPVKFSWEKRQFFYLALYCLVLSIPFFFSGILIVTAFSLYSEKSMLIYSSDLLGAGTGSLAVLAILNIAGPEYAVLSASTVCLIGALITGRKITKILALIFAAVNLLFFLAHPDLIHVKMSPYKRLPLYLKYPGAEHLNTYHSSYSQIDTFNSPAVRFAPGLSLKYLEPLPQQTGFSIDGNSINVITEAKGKSRLRFLEFLPSSVVYELRRNDDVIVIDPKGGLQALVARHYGSREIHKVESNPMIVKIIRDDFSEFSGNIFDRNTWTGYGRNVLDGLQYTVNDSGSQPVRKKASSKLSNVAYDVIDLSMTGASVSGIFGISEDYRYTVEAFKKYISALKTDGIMSISIYLIPPPRTEFRILATIVTALEQMDVKDTFNRIAALRSWDSMTLLLKNSPLTSSEIDHIKIFSRNKRFDLVYYPGIKEGESNKYVKMPSDEYSSGFKKILDPETRTSFMNNYLFDIKPVYDNNPFFHYYLKLENIKAIYEKMGRKWSYFLEEGYLLPVIFIIVIVLSFVLILLPVIFNAIRKNRFERFKLSSSLPVLTYFSMLGFGFMFVEVSLIQKSILLFENPSYSVAVVLTAILVSSGTGSMISSKLSKLRTSYSLLILALLILLYSLVHPLLLNLLSAYTLKFKIAIISIALIPLGFFMGIPFPMGIKLIGQKYEELIPWAWAINACLSVLAPILTIMLALVIGFKSVLWIGSLTYLLAFVSLRRLY